MLLKIFLPLIKTLFYKFDIHVMKNDVKFIIPKPCKMDFNEMNICDNTKIRFCENCKSNVHDIRNLSKDEIKDLKKSKKDKICVIANSNQLLTSNRIRKIALSSLVIFSSFFSNEINAQYKSKLSSFEIKQSFIRTDSIQVSGFVYVKGTFGWKKVSNYNVDIYLDGKLVDSKIITKNKKFTLKYEYGNFDNISLVITYKKNYEALEIKDLRLINSKIKVFLAPKRFQVIGRFF